MKTLLTLLFVFTSLAYSTAQLDCEADSVALDANLLSADLAPRSLWNIGDSPGLTYPTGSGTSIAYAGGIWVSNRRSDGNVGVAIMQYGNSSGNYDYATGPIIRAPFIRDSSAIFCSVAKVSRSQVNAHLADLADGTLHNPIAEVLNWPGRGNVELNLIANDQDLAPFVDVHANNVYEPRLGDYPAFRGDQATWWVVNDFVTHEESMVVSHAQVEVQVLAQAFTNSATADSSSSQLYSVKAINRSDATQDSFAVSLWVDPDLGCSDDDNMGTIPSLNSLYSYNADSLDGFVGTVCGGRPTFGNNVPIAAFRVLDAWVGNSSVAVRTSAIEVPVFSSSLPAPRDGIAQTYYQVMHGRWADGTPITIGGDGYRSQGDSTNWIYSGNPADATSWSQCGNQGSDVRAILNANLLQPLAPNEAFEVDFAVVVVDGIPLPCPNSDLIAAEVEKASNHLLTGNTSSSREVRAEAAALSVWPNPSSGRFSITLPAGVQVEQVRVLDAAGRVVEHSLHQSSATSLDVELSSKGVFLVSVEDTRGYYRYAKIVVR